MKKIMFNDRYGLTGAVLRGEEDIADGGDNQGGGNQGGGNQGGELEG